MLDLKPVDYPSWLGEDDLAEFGAYREHPETPSDQTAPSHSTHAVKPTA
jgi:hypothetical protein